MPIFADSGLLNDYDIISVKFLLLFYTGVHCNLLFYSASSVLNLLYHVAHYVTCVIM